MNRPLLILGASVRAAAFSALRAGLRPYCGDLFADLDLVRCAAAVRVQGYPGGLAEVAASAPPSPWMYTGGLENHPGLVDRIAAGRPLWGNPGPVLRAVRDPRRVARALCEAGIPHPAIAMSPEDLPTDGTWLRKPLAASGGIGIRPWRRGPLPKDKAAAWCYFQERIAGVSLAAVYVAAGGQSVLLGVTRQLVGTRWTGAADFRYAGSIGPLPLDEAARALFESIGHALSAAFGLVGLFGVDAVLSEAGRKRGLAHGDCVWGLDRELWAGCLSSFPDSLSTGTVWPVEVNPRYTASIEVLERALGIAAIALHADACRDGTLPPEPVRAAETVCGKAVLYARADLAVSEAFARFAEAEMCGPAWPDLADVPAVATPIRAGMPVTTVFAQRDSHAAVVEALHARAREVEGLLGTPGS